MDAVFHALPDHAVIALEGPDATAYAHAQFANDVTGLQAGNWQWNTWLTPKGRVIALFALLKLADDRLVLLVPDAEADTLVAQWQQMVFRRKLKISTRRELHPAGAFTEPGLGRSARIVMQDRLMELDYGDARHPRILRISEALPATTDPGFTARWAAADLRQGVPRLGAPQRGQWTPQQLSLDRLDAFSVKKGCYPGQEIVARTHFLGKAKRGLSLFKAGLTIAPGAEVSDGSRIIGNVVSVADDGDEHLALAVLPLERETIELPSLTANGIALSEIPLPENPNH